MRQREACHAGTEHDRALKAASHRRRSSASTGRCTRPERGKTPLHGSAEARRAADSKSADPGQCVNTALSTASRRRKKSGQICLDESDASPSTNGQAFSVMVPAGDLAVSRGAQHST